jgi:hypothetical protein
MTHPDAVAWAQLPARSILEWTKPTLAHGVLAPMFARKAIPSDRRPPPISAIATLGPCVRCGAEVAPFDRLPGRELVHFVCDAGTRAGVTRRIEAMRSMHRAALALARFPIAKAQLDREMTALPDAAEVAEILDALGRVRVAVECSPQMAADQRRLALSYLDALCRKLAD